MGLFVTHFSALRHVLLSLYPLIRQSLIKHHSEMASIEYRVDDVRSSELKTGLSFNAESLCKVVDTVASKFPSSSSSLSLHAFSESCSLKKKHLNGFRKMFQFLRGTSIKLSRLGEKACNFAHGNVCFYKADFLCDLRFPVHPFIMQLLNEFQITLGQLVLNVWRMIISCISI